MEAENEKSSAENAALFRALVQRIEEICLRGPVKSWTQRDFIFLSESILEKTGEPLSVTTLKRILGKVQYQGLPYPNTLSLLARFCGYPHWEAFKATELQNVSSTFEAATELNLLSAVDEQTTETHPTQKVQPKTDIRFWFQIGILTCAAFALGWWMAIFQHPESASHALVRHGGESSGRLEYTMKDSLFPREVTFAYSGPVPDPADLTVITCESGKMQYFNINPEGFGQSTYTYAQPGLYHAKVFSNNRQLAFSPVLVASKSWLLSCRIGQKDIGQELTQGDEKVLWLSPSKLFSKGIDTTARFHTRIRQFKDFGLSGDSLSLSMDLFNQASNMENRDQLVSLRLRCGNYPLILQLANWMPRDGFFVQVSEKLFETAQRKQFSNLIQPMEKWQKLTIKTSKNQTRVWIGNRLILQEKYRLPFGKLYGIELEFVGSGKMKNLQLAPYTDK